MTTPSRFIARRRLLAAVPALASAAALPAAAQSASIPAAPVKLVLGFAPGTSLDILARTVAKKVEETWTAGVVVENRAGAGGMIALAGVGTSAPDGQTLLLSEFGALAIAPNAYRKLQFDPGQLTPVVNLVTGDMTFITGAQNGAKNLDEWRAATRSASRLLVGTFGPATPHHLLAVMLGEALGRPVEPVHFRAPQELIAAVSGGDLHGAFVTSTLAMAWAQSGKINIVGVASPTRAPVLPNVRTFREDGLERADYNGWAGIFAPPKTPDALVDRAQNVFADAVRSADVRKKTEEIGLRPFVQTRREFEQQILADRANVKRITDAINLKLD